LRSGWRLPFCWGSAKQNYHENGQISRNSFLDTAFELALILMISYFEMTLNGEIHKVRLCCSILFDKKTNLIK
jgi:hypothetical protein